MTDRPLKHLEDVLDSIDLIKQYAAGLSLEEYVLDLQARDAVERRFAIISEALDRLKRDDEELYARVGHARQIKSFRNIIVHVYDSVDQEVVWRIIHDDLPRLREEVQVLMNERTRESGDR